MKDEITLGTLTYGQYFDAFNDIDQLKKAATIWVKEDIERIEKLEEKLKTQNECIKELVGCLEEAVDLTNATISGEYEPDSFTDQPWRILLKKIKELENK